MWWSLFNKVANIQACNFIKKRLQHRHFPVKFEKFLRTPVSKNICETTASFSLLTILLTKYRFVKIQLVTFLVFSLYNKCKEIFLEDNKIHSRDVIT